MERKREFIVLVFLVALVGFFYLKILSGFFVQDEWYGFGWHLSKQGEGLTSFFVPTSAHYNPLTDLITNRLFFLWGLDYPKFAYLGIVLHLSVIGLVYILSRAVFKKETPALVSALAFGVFASPYQGIAWVVTNIATLSASFFGVTSAILFFKFLEKKKDKFFIGSLVALLVSLLFKEITIGLLALYFVLLFSNLKKYAFLVASLGGVYVAFRFLVLPIATAPLGGSNIGVVLYNFLTLPLKSLVQLLFPSEFLKSIFITLSPGSERVAFEILMEIFVVLVGLGVLIWGAVRLKGIALLGVGWVIVNSLIFSISPGVVRAMNIVDSRNLYFVAVGTAVFLAALPKRFLVFVILLLILNGYWLNRNLGVFTQYGAARKSILEKIAGSYPEIPEKVVFYTESDSPYYGLPDSERILPFQSGFGQTLLIYYAERQPFPREFFPGDYLWDIKAQGYEEHEGRGFGYFRDITKLKEAIKKNNLSAASVIGFSWKKETSELTDISDRIRHEVNR